MVGETPETDTIIRVFLLSFDTLPIDTHFSEVAVTLRKNIILNCPMLSCGRLLKPIIASW